LSERSVEGERSDYSLIAPGARRLQDTVLEMPKTKKTRIEKNHCIDTRFNSPTGGVNSKKRTLGVLQSLKRTPNTSLSQGGGSASLARRFLACKFCTSSASLLFLTFG